MSVWRLPFHHRDPIGVELRVTVYELDSGGRGLQITLESKHAPQILAMRLPDQKAGGLAMRILAELDGPAACCRELDAYRGADKHVEWSVWERRPGGVDVHTLVEPDDEDHAERWAREQAGKIRDAGGDAEVRTRPVWTVVGRWETVSWPGLDG